ncbi:hypothetical protein TCE0_015r02604 [Talaromyces pinophilus]|uniref:T6SS Phospholipase effector Tle1-like catalytic domain-containing protein n=1 Tax=Talaromyces pinophilus TaxID=128442 RepID=A0A6V8H3Y4_TALPI|nr:hypothetical protein TCE0_015r02604 [Talaromyces pinophilus]
MSLFIKELSPRRAVPLTIIIETASQLLLFDRPILLYRIKGHLCDESVPSNVAKIARSIATSGPDADGMIVKQIVSYHSGRGTGDLPFQADIYGSLGWGLDVDVCHMYGFVANNYVPGDELFFFGFSRGAFTVDNLSGMLTFEEMAINKLIKEHHDALVENNARNNVINGWGVGPLFPTSPGCKVPSSGFLGSKIAHQAAIREMQATEIVAPRMSISIRSPASGSPSSPTITQHR